MYKINWDNSFNTNIEIVDKQHFDFINQLNKIFANDPGLNISSYKQRMERIIAELLIHFATEEKLMKDNSYTGFYSHKLEHDRFINKFRKQAEELPTVKFSKTDDFLLSIEKWFVNHLEINDKKMARFILQVQNENGINI
ncbi:MAG: bacteriohemerythrin [Ignavibacteriales bacterium]